MNNVHNWPAIDSETAGERPVGAAGTETPVGPAGGALDWLLTGLVLGCLWWTTLGLGGYRPGTLPVAVTLIALAIVVWLAREAWTRGGLRLSYAAAAALAFLAYAAFNAGWISPVRWLGWQDWLVWAQMAGVFCVVSHGITRTRPRAALFWGVVALGVVAVILAGYQRLADPRWLMLGRQQAPQFLGRSSGPFGIPNSLAAFLNLLLPPLLALTVRRGTGVTARWFCGYLAALFACGLLLTVSRGAWLALGVALTAWPLLAGGDHRRRWLGAIGVAAALALVAGVAYWRDARIRERVDQLLHQPLEPSRSVLWRAGWLLFREHPLAGSGAGSYAVLFERHRPERFWDAPRWTHNDYLNTLSDYGAIGFLLAFGTAAAVAWGWRSSLRPGAAGADDVGRAPEERPRALEIGLGIGLLAFALQLFIDFNLKIPALAQLAAALAGLVLASGAAGRANFWRRTFRLPRGVPVIAGLAVVIALPSRILPLYRAEARRYEARQELDRLVLRPSTEPEAGRQLALVRERLIEAVGIDPRNAQAWADLADTLLQQSRAMPAQAGALGREAEAAATQALAHSTVVPEFWVSRGLALDLQGRWRDAWADFVEALRLAPRRADVWYYYAYHLSLRDLESAKSALATCLSLDPWNGPALAFKKELGGSQ